MLCPMEYGHFEQCPQVHSYSQCRATVCDELLDDNLVAETIYIRNSLFSMKGKKRA